MSTRILFLPIAAERLKDAFAGDDAVDPHELSLYEVISAVAVDRMLAGTDAGKSRSIVVDTVEQSVIAALFQSASSDSEGTHEQAARLLLRAKRDEPDIIKRLDKIGVSPMSPGELDRERFVTPFHKLWRKEYRDEATRQALEPATTINARGEDVPTDVNTARTTSRMRAELGESGSVQGVAGCGKTQSLTSVVANTPRDANNQILILTLTQDQSNATRRRLERACVNGIGITIRIESMREHLMNLVMWMTPIGYARSRASSSYHTEEEIVASALGIHRLSFMDRRQVTQAVSATVSRFCYSSDRDIGPQHCPDWVKLSEGEARILVEHANQYWQTMQDPSQTGLGLPLRLHHLWKIAELAQLPISREIASVVVDEAHDVPAGIIRWLRSNDGVGLWLLGDEFQHYGKHPQPFFALAGNYRQTLTHSYRCGRDSEDLINPLLERHPANEQAGVTFEGHPNDAFRVRRFGRNVTPPDNTVVVCANEADCLEYVFRLRHEGVSLALLGRTQHDIPAYLRGLVGLYVHGKRARTASLWRYTSWDQLMASHPHSTALTRIQDMLARGFGDADCERVCAEITDPRSKPSVCLALPSSIKNSQFPRVQLSRALLHGTGNESAKAQLLSQIYTAQTRATGELIVPGEYRDWINNLQ